MNWCTETPSSRFSNKAATGTLVPLKTQAPLTRSGSRSTAGQVDHSIIFASYLYAAVTPNGPANASPAQAKPDSRSFRPLSNQRTQAPR